MEPKTIPEDLIIKLEESIRTSQKILAEISSINEQNIDNEYREWSRDYERSIAC